ncbi:hypothetical protein [Leptolyngbya sp. FACHB-711]|uniref:hypothetical protein n=1 Tax=Leptolyngbya sp. FACHB-711 TaxID=2692813 RepID=UPI0016826B29|nr:hypothetical protein [Leptolyngbya sp. FACHB-711]MBD2023795.1 hypothetical protein [Leptolyngbya sp. FACHB-711]
MAYQPIFNSKEQMFSGLNSYLDRLGSAFSSQVLQSKLPFIGNQIRSSSVGSFFSRIRSSLQSQIQVYPGDFGYGEDVADVLFKAWGNTPGGLGVLQDLNGDNTITVADIQIDDQTFSTGEGYGGYVDFKLRLSQSSTFTTALTSDLGLPELGLELNGNNNVEIDYSFDLNFGYELSGTGYTGNSTFYAETKDSKDISINVKANPSIPGVGKLGILPIQATNQGSTLEASFSTNIKDSADADTRLSITELLGLSDDNLIDTSLAGRADLKVNLATNFPSQAKFPSLSTDFRIDWSLNSSELNPGQPQTLGGVPRVEFRDVKLDMGSFMGNFLSPILQRVNDVTQPIRSITDKLTTPIAPLSKLLKRDVNFFDIAEIIGKADPDFKLDLGFIKAAANLISLAGSLPNANGTFLNFGNLVLEGVDVRSPSFNLSSFNPVGGSISYTGSNGSAVKSFVDSLQSGKSGVGTVGLPILTDTTAAFKLLLGNPNVTLIDYQMPTLNVNVTGGQTIYVIGPVGVRFEGTIGANVNLKVGFDTAGLFRYSTSNNVADIFENGFFLDSRVAPLTINAGVSAGPAIDLSALARVTVQGGLVGTIDFNWRDDKNPNDPNKVRLSELSTNLGSFNMFSVSGQLDAAMKFSAFVIGLGSYELPLGAVALYPSGATPRAFSQKSQNRLPRGVEKLLNLPQSVKQAASKLGVEAAKRVFGPKTGPRLVGALSKLDPTRSRLVRKSGILDLATGNPAAGANLLVKHGPAAIDVLAKSNAGKRVAKAAKAAVSQAPKVAKRAQKQLSTAIKQTDKALSSAKKTAQKPAQVVKKAAPVVQQVFSPRSWSRW